jgi:oligoribonuclease
MTSNAFAALQGLNDAQLPRAIASAGGGKAKKTTASAPAPAAAAAADGGGGGGGGGGGASSSAPSSKKLPPAAAAAAAAAAGEDDDDDDGFTPVVVSRGKRADKQQQQQQQQEAAPAAPAAGKSAAAAAAAAKAASGTAKGRSKANDKAIAEDSRGSGKAWADEIEEAEDEAPPAAASSGDDADAAPADAKKEAGAAAAGTTPTTFLRDPLVWVDLEMTGLDPRTDTIIEIAVMVSDGQLQRVVEGPEIAIHHPDDVLDGMNEWSREQHAKSGLTARCRASATSLADAEAQVVAFVRRHCDYQAGLLAGNSVHVDRAFLQARMPSLTEHLHYRIVDVSSVAELARRWHPRAWREAPKKRRAHTAMADVRESLAELRYYRERLFNKRA